MKQTKLTRQVRNNVAAELPDCIIMVDDASDYSDFVYFYDTKSERPVYRIHLRTPRTPENYQALVFRGLDAVLDDNRMGIAWCACLRGTIDEVCDCVVQELHERYNV